MAKRGTSGLSFLVAIDKPVGISSHDVVNRLRWALGEGRIGHFGTLDPLASGVMVVGVGPAARLMNYLVDHDKTYVARIVFGQERNTDDAEGVPIAEAPVPAQVGERPFAENVLSDFVGELHQVPPQFSAIKRGGVTAYTRARAGEAIDLAPRDIRVHSAELLEVAPDEWTVRFCVSKGTYIRALARDIGRAVGCGAYLGGLRRERLGDIGLDACMTLEDVENVSELRLLDPVELLGYPCLDIPEAERKALMNGAKLPVFLPDMPLAYQGLVCALCDDELKAIYRVSDMPYMDCDCLFSIGVARG